jgi:UDP:flavonoid glycosyltransferase YjiC (YdhE family)
MMQEIRNLQRFRPHVVVSDSRASSLLAAKLMGIPSVLLLNQYRVDIVRRPSNHTLSIIDRLFFFFANLSWIFLRTLLGGVWGRSDAILIPDFPPPHTVSASNLTIPNRYRRKVNLIGPIIPEANSTHVPRNQLVLGLGADPSKPLVYAAISGPKIERTYLANILISELAKLGEDYTIVLSKGDPTGPRESTRAENIIVFGWIEDQLSYLKVCDLVICRAGHGIITKAIAFGKPMILIPIPDHTEQHGNAKRVQAFRRGIMIEQHELTAENLRKAASQLLGRKGTIENQRLSKPPLGDGTSSAVQIITLASGFDGHKNSLSGQ